MPHCEGCQAPVDSEKLHKDVNTDELLCGPCADQRPIVQLPLGKTILGRDFDYDFSYSKKEGIKASARLGTATLSLHVPQEELTKVIG